VSKVKNMKSMFYNVPLMIERHPMYNQE